MPVQDHVFTQQVPLCSAVGAISLVERNVEINILDLNIFAPFPFLQCVQNMVL